MKSVDSRASSVTGAGALPSTSVTDRLRASLAEASRLLEDFAREQQQEPDIVTYRKCCRHLITYITTQMQTSPGFTEQMEQVIHASYNNSDGLALRSLVTGELWLRYSEGTAVPNTPARQGPDIKVDEAVNGAVTVTPIAVANANVTGLRPTCSPHVDLTVSTPPTVGRGAKRESKRGALAPQELKRPRHTVVRNLYGAGRLDCEEKGEDSELEGEKVSDTESETEIHVYESRELNHPARPLVLSGESGGGFVWPCTTDNPSKRTSAYMQRLKTAIKLVDAENCCPPLGMVCRQGCSGIRKRMCETHRTLGGNSKPCHNGMCCIWSQIDTHLVRCQNSQCEFKNLVGLRQTMHDIKRQSSKLEATSGMLMQTKVLLRCVGCGDECRCESSSSQLVSEIKKLEEKCTKLEDSVAFHEERERTFLDDLNYIGSLANDELGWLPSFNDHYA